MTQYGNEQTGTDPTVTGPHGSDPTGAQRPGGPGPANDQTAPPAAAASPVRQLVRDPNTKLGGVSSGLGYYLGVDVSLVRLAFVLTTIFTGVGLIIYPLAWLILPRAEYWPPVGAQPLHRLSSRQAAVGLAAVGLLIILFINGGGLAQTLVPVLLVGVGVWMLRQPEVGPTGAPPTSPLAGTSMPHPAAGSAVPSPVDPTRPMTVESPAVGPFTASDAPQASDTVPSGTVQGGTVPGDPASGQVASGFPGTAPPHAAPPPPPPTWTSTAIGPGAPIPPRRRRWPRVLGILAGLFFLFLLVVGALIVGLVAGSGLDFEPSFSATYRPDAVEDIPATIVHDSGEIVLDLTALDATDFNSGDASSLDDVPNAGSDLDPVSPVDDDGPLPIRIDLDFGEVRVLVPEGLPVSVDAAVDLGDIDVFDDSADGIDPDLRIREADAVVDLDIDIGFGQITVEQVEATG